APRFARWTGARSGQGPVRRVPAPVTCPQATLMPCPDGSHVCGCVVPAVHPGSRSLTWPWRDEDMGRLSSAARGERRARRRALSVAAGSHDDLAGHLHEVAEAPEVPRPLSSSSSARLCVLCASAVLRKRRGPRRLQNQVAQLTCSTTRKRALPLSIRSYASAARARGKTSFIGRTP